MIIDVHAHHFLYTNPINVLQENREKGVYIIIENGLDPETNRKVVEISKKFDIVHPALGYHPVDIAKSNDSMIEQELKYITERINELIAIGEVGLDYYWVRDKISIEKQKKWFLRILELSEIYKKPIIVHSRKAEKDVIELATSYNSIIILHSFWKPSLTKLAVEHGMYISIPTFVYKDKGLQKIVQYTPLDLLLTESDAPFLDPIDKRNNKSWKIIYSLEKIAEIKGLNIGDIKAQIAKNFERAFDIEILC
ncbi:MAG TPA: TatD family deoxyribonuclease [Candidatus Nanopusillus sp.]|nr:TatD family deoxyribonuclease [Candidatus Nanopusillus sp.]